MKRRYNMKRLGHALTPLAVLAFILIATPLAYGQATRTWVSGVGDDVNPCSRTAPCKTFAGAISKTAVNGEIDALDPGGFGTLTITKGITVDGKETMASVLATGAPSGFTVNIGGGGVPAAADTQQVKIRNISINGTGGSAGAAGSGVKGIRILVAKSVSVENCTIFDFQQAAGRGISDERTAANSNLYVNNTTIENSGQHGIILLNANITANFDHIRVYNNGVIGLAVSGAKATVSNSVFQGHATNAGLEVEASGVLDVESSVTSHNLTGVLAQSGATARLSNVNITQNGTGVNNGSIVRSFGNNKIDGNTTANTSGAAILGPGTGGPSQQ
jgi:hypothetical protein